MNSKTKKLIQSYILDYLKLKVPNFTASKKIFKCPLGHEHKDNIESANIFPPDSYRVHCFDPNHGTLGDIFNMVRLLEPEMKDLDDDSIGSYLTDLFKIKTDDKINNLFSKYSEYEWCLFPLKKQGLGNESKQPIQANWQKTNYKNIQQWMDWIKSGSGLALNLGEVSNAIAIDIDSDETYEKTKKHFNETAHQKTKRGYGHLVYQYDKDFDHINHVNLRSKGYEMEVRANNAYIVVAPTSCEGEVREWNDIKPKKMSKELKKFLLDLIEKPKEIKQNVDNKENNLSNTNLTGLDGCCNDTMIAYGGALRKKLSVEHTTYSLLQFNKMLNQPLEEKQIYAMCQQLDRYDNFDKKGLAEDILKHLNVIEQATARDLRDSLRQDKKDIEEALDYLIKENKVYKQRSVYKVMKKVEWNETFIDESKLLDFKVPYLNNYAVCRQGDMILIGAKTGVGKSHLAINIIKELVDQGVKPYYISSEAGNRFTSIAMTLGLKEGEFRWFNHYKPEQLELEDNAVTIIDWLLPDNFAETANLYQKFAQQLDKHGGLLFIFTQLTVEGVFFAKNLIDLYASVCCVYEQIDNDPYNTCLKTKKIRESKVGRQYLTIPTKYDPNTKRVTLR